MASKIKDLKQKFLSTTGDNRIKILVVIGLVGIVLIAMSDSFPKSENKRIENDLKSNYLEYVDLLEKDTEEIISSIDGVGECRVMITLKNSNENIYAKNSEENVGSGNYSKNDEYVFYDENNGDSPLLLKENYASVQGVVVVCSGGDNTKVKECVIKSIVALYDIPSNKISVSKLKL